MKKPSPLCAIRNHCCQYSGFVLKEVRLCLIMQCPLYSYRFGSNPARKGVGKIAKTKIDSNDAENLREKAKITENQPLNEALKEVPLV